MQEMIEIHPFFRPGFGQSTPETVLNETLELELREAYTRLLQLTLQLGTGPQRQEGDRLEQNLQILQFRQADFLRRLRYLQACGQASTQLSRLFDKYKMMLISYTQLLEVSGLRPWTPSAS